MSDQSKRLIYCISFLPEYIALETFAIKNWIGWIWNYKNTQFRNFPVLRRLHFLGVVGSNPTRRGKNTLSHYLHYWFNTEMPIEEVPLLSPFLLLLLLLLMLSKNSHYVINNPPTNNEFHTKIIFPSDDGNVFAEIYYGEK